MRKWPLYRYDEHGVIRPGPECPKVNFEKLKSLLLETCTPENEEAAEKYLSRKDPLFLDSMVNMSGNRVQLASFPRSGNSFLRKVLEQITGVYTGSDFHMRDTLPLQHSGLLGE
jgi:hypothetical protein